MSRDDVQWIVHLLNEQAQEKHNLSTDPFPEPQPTSSMSAPFVWRIRLQMAADTRVQMEIDLAAPITLGIAPDSPDSFDLSTYGAATLGVSQAHVRLEPTPDAIYATDVGSTNGTTLNGESLKPGVPVAIRHGDHLMLGDLAFIVHVIDTPGEVLSKLREMAELSEIVIQMAQTIPAQLEVDAIFEEALQTAMGITSAGKIAVWLVKDGQESLTLAAENFEAPTRRSMESHGGDPALRHTLTAGEPFAALRELEGNGSQAAITAETESVLYVPMNRGREAIGVFEIVHREGTESFTPRDVKVFTVMADLCAVAIQNARQYQAILQSDQQKADMMQTIGHEFRSPLQYIAGYASMILDEKKENQQITEAEEQGLGVILQQTKKLASLASNFVMFKTATKVAELRAASDLGEIVEDAIAGALMEAENKRITLRAELAQDIPQAWVSPMAIHQVLDNLLGNALKFTPSGGRVTVRTQGLDDRTWLLVEVEDSGIGIAAEDQERIFHRFGQVNPTQSASMGSVGLGLAVCKEIVEAHGGSISVISKPGKGAIFRFTVPAAWG